MKTATLIWTTGILGGAVTLSLYHLLRIHNKTRNIPPRQIKSSPSVPATFHKSAAVSIVNPHSHSPVHDTRSISLRLPSRLGDEEILARFIKGFFGGHVFAIERNILIAVKKEITNFKTIANIPISAYIWSSSALSAHSLPPVHALLFGAFRLVDRRISSTEGYSYVDFAFGSDMGAIAGVHRFSVSHGGGDDKLRSSSSEGEGDTGKKDMVDVVIEFAHSGCNPRENKELGPEFLQMLHLWYAMLLFKEGLGEVIKLSH